MWAVTVVAVLVVVAVVILATSGSSSSKGSADASAPASTPPSPALTDSSTCTDWSNATTSSEQSYADGWRGDGGTVNGTDAFTFLNDVCNSSSTYDYSNTTIGDLLTYLANNGDTSQPCDDQGDSLPACQGGALDDASTCTDWNAATYSDEQVYAQQYDGDGGTVNGTDVYSYLNTACGSSASGSPYDYTNTTLGDLMTYLVDNGYSSQPCDGNADSLPAC